MPEDYELLYTSLSGAHVWAHPLHVGVERPANLEIACFLADAIGETVYLLPISDEPGARNPDAKIGGADWEFKTNHTGTGTAIDTEIKRAKRQANKILLNLTVLVDALEFENAVYNRIRQSPNVECLRLIYQGKLFEFTREQIMSQQFRGCIKGEGSPA